MERYERLEKIGEGASGVVYKARDSRTGDSVAVKRLRGGGCYNDDDAEVFLREARCLEACRDHPRLVGLRDAHSDAAAAFLVMEYVGPSMAVAAAVCFDPAEGLVESLAEEHCDRPAEDHDDRRRGQGREH